MTEIERQNIVKEINKKIENNKNINELREELNLLKKDKKIKRYFELLNKLNDIEYKNNTFLSTDEIVKIKFRNSFNDGNITQCNHDIWIYEGSYYLMMYNENENYLKSNTEKNESFKFNQYICLECGNLVRISQWEEFEKKHFVLKNQNDVNNAYYYNNFYYQLLYNNSIEEAKKMIINEFNSNKDNKTLIKKNDLNK